MLHKLYKKQLEAWKEKTMPLQIKQAKLREEREARFLKAFKAGEFINPLTGGHNPFKIETWWLEEIKQAKLETLEAIIKEVEGMKKLDSLGRLPIRGVWEGYYNQALSDLLTKLRAEKELIENSK